MKYTQTTTQFFNIIPLGKNVPTFKTISSGAGKTAPFFVTTSTKKKIKYQCAHNIDDIDDRGVIEIPATNDTVIYQDEEGQYYEVPVSDLIDYDGDDGEITYHSKSIFPLNRKAYIKDNPNYYLNLLAAKNIFMQNRIYNA